MAEVVVTESAFEQVARKLDEYRDWIVDVQTTLTAIPALDPASGGDGEAAKAEVVGALLRELGVSDVKVLACDDPRTTSGKRPNLVARIPGRDRTRCVWLMSHLDVVPAGELADWHSDPWKVRVEGNRIYGRGVEDNQQGLVGSLALARALRDTAVVPPVDLGLLFVADEETGNKCGIEYLLANHDIFGPEDLIIVPDGGLPDGTQVEVAEKGIAWIRCQVRGRSTHGSTPEKGINAHRAAAELIVRLDDLHRRFDRRDDVFDPPTSTFPVTKVEAGVPNVNTIPGEHTFYLDCRVLPDYTLDEVLSAVRETAAEVDRAFGTTTTAAIQVRQDAAPATPVNAPVVEALVRAVEDVYGVRAVPMGIGGGTVAACIRRKGYAAAVWAKQDETMHGPNEYCIIDNLIGDAKVFAHVLLEAPRRTTH